MLKRFLDVCVAVCFLALTFPLCLLIALAIWVESGRPIFFRQERNGFNGKPFLANKFRTMYRADPHHRPSRNHKNITRVGRLLRPAHLDELPQFWNLLKGDLTLVGPRAQRKIEMKPAELMLLKPGITGPGHLHKKPVSQEEHQENYAVEIEYFHGQRTMFKDFLILLKTAIKVFQANSF
jgi:lipopolysaccharide/colanic/teichoic acid biosynthesis glycosyltransferase